MFKKQTKEFFELYDRLAPNFEIMANVYKHSYFSQITKIVKKKNETLLIIPSLTLVDYTDDIVNTSEKEVADTVSNLLQITDHINNSDEIVSYSKCYERFIISRLIKQQEFNEYRGKSKVILNIFNNL